MTTKLNEILTRIAGGINPENCVICKTAIDYIFDQMTSQEPVTFNLSPDRNANGHVTHWHIASPDMKPRTEARKQFLFDVFVTGLEGGIGYWAYSEKYHWTNDKGKTEDLEGFFSIVVDTEAEPGEEGAFERSRIDADIIEKGINRILNDPQFKISDSIKETIRKGSVEMDAGEIDSDGADCIIQAGLLGSITFG